MIDPDGFVFWKFIVLMVIFYTVGTALVMLGQAAWEKLKTRRKR